MCFAKIESEKQSVTMTVQKRRKLTIILNDFFPLM